MGLDRRCLTWVTIALGMLGALIATPAFADPNTPGGVPDPGVPPVATGPLTPGGSAPATQSATPVVGPMADKIRTARAQVETLGEQVLKLGLDVDAAKQTTEQTRKAWQDAKAQADRLKDRADSAAAKAYKDATQLGPWGDHANDVNQLDELVPGGLANDPGDSSTASAVLDAASAAALEQTTSTAYEAAVAAQQRLEADKTSKTAAHDQQAAALADLVRQNTAAAAQLDAAEDAANAKLAASFAAGTNTKGQAPNPVAVAAVRAAMSKLGSPYVWGTEGPFTFDCSGLVLWSYHQAGYRGLPRVAADQYHATKPIDPTELLVGDLLFFSTTSKSDWTSISHVGMYVGGDFMIEAPNSGSVVKIAHIWKDAFFGATRVVDAVPAPAPAPPPANNPPPSPSPPGRPLPTPPSTPPSKPPSSGPPSSAPPSSAPPSAASSSSPSPTPSPAANQTPTTAASSSTKP
jgi:cell wall-associated NlpC family hydrolase